MKKSGGSIKQIDRRKIYTDFFYYKICIYFAVLNTDFQEELNGGFYPLAKPKGKLFNIFCICIVLSLSFNAVKII